MIGATFTIHVIIITTSNLMQETHIEKTLKVFSFHNSSKFEFSGEGLLLILQHMVRQISCGPMKQMHAMDIQVVNGIQIR